MLLILLYSTIVHAQEIPVSNNDVSKDNIESLRHTWKSSWVSHPTASLKDYGVFLYRKKFTLKKLPNTLGVYVSGDNRYKLYVNGKYVSNGPARGDQLHWNYETVDLKPFLKQGDNIIAAEVINFGPNRPVAQHTFQTAFLLQAEDNAYDELNTTSNNWKVKKSEAYQPIPISFGMVNGYYAAGPGDSVNAKLFDWNWKELNCDESTWINAEVSNMAVGRGYIYGNQVHLVPRNIPVLERKNERFNKVVRANNISVEQGEFIKGKPTIIKKNSTVSFLLDQSYLTIGYPQLSISKGAGSKIKITYAEALHDSKGIKGNRNNIEGKQLDGYYDVYYPDGGDDRLFESLWVRTFRYVRVDIKTGNDDLVIHDFSNIFTAFPFVQKATFTTDKAGLDEIWNTAWRTARLCAGETYFDCPYYEQLQYVGDTRIQALISLSVAGDDRLMRNALLLFDHSRFSDGLTLSRYPSDIPQIIPTYSLMWINMIHDYYLYRNDSAFIKQFDHGMVEVLEWFNRKIDSTGMLANLEWWNFTDYTDPYAQGIADGVDGGHSATTTLQFVYALQNAAELFKYFGEKMYAERYSLMAAKIQKAVMLHCYDKTRKLIAETPEKKRFSQHTTLFAILTNTIDKSEQAPALKRVLADTSVIGPSFYFQFYLSRGLQKTGLGDQYISALDPFYKMLGDGLTTFAEMAGNPRSDCHAWSASPLYDFMSLVAGIQPAGQGFTSVKIEPNFGPLKNINATYPHPEGDIILHLTKSGNEIKGTIKLPAHVSGTFIYHNKKVILPGDTETKITLTF